MKPVILTLLLVLVVSQSDALRCYCGGLKPCSSHVETCYGSDQVCASVIIMAGSSVKYFQGCYSEHQCAVMNSPPISTASCCRTDLCNN